MLILGWLGGKASKRRRILPITKHIFVCFWEDTTSEKKLSKKSFYRGSRKKKKCLYDPIMPYILFQPVECSGGRKKEQGKNAPNPNALKQLYCRPNVEHGLLPGGIIDIAETRNPEKTPKIGPLPCITCLGRPCRHMRHLVTEESRG